MSSINAHVYTDPVFGKQFYYWSRIIDDKVYGINGFSYLTDGANISYYVLPSDVTFSSPTHVLLKAMIQWGPKKIPTFLTMEFQNVGTKMYAGYVATKVMGGDILEQQPLTLCLAPGNYIKLDSKK